MNLLNRT